MTSQNGSNSPSVSGTIFAQILPLAFAVFVSPDLGTVIPGAVLARVLLMLAIFVAINRIEGPIRITDFDMDRARKLLSYGGWVTISSVLTPILGSLDQLMVGRFFGVAAVTYYAVPLNLISRSQIIPGAISRAIFPRLASSEAEEAKALSARARQRLHDEICARALCVEVAWASPQEIDELKHLQVMRRAKENRPAHPQHIGLPFPALLHPWP